MLYLSKEAKRLIAKQAWLETLEAEAKQYLEDLEAKVEARRLMAGRPLGKLDSRTHFR